MTRKKRPLALVGAISAIVEELAERALKESSVENTVRTAVEGGMRAAEAWQTYGALCDHSSLAAWIVRRTGPSTETRELS